VTDTLGHLLWWTVGEVDLDLDRLERVLDGTGVTLPTRPIPMDVFRRVTGSAKSTVEVPDGELVLTLFDVDAPSEKMLVKHIVGTVYDEKRVTKVIRKAGDVAFYYPPRGKNAKARMRVAPVAPFEGWAGPVRAFAAQLQQAYENGVRGALDGQAVRRLIRAHLTKVKALYLDGPYYVQTLHETEAVLRPLFGALGEDSFYHTVPLPDLDRHRKLLVRGLERAIKAGVEVDETIWELVE
jgi:hypothetical protein